MKTPVFLVPAVLAAALMMASPAVPQSVGSDATIEPQDSFASENAILDTSVLFAIGATEARQSLRGAFGWPTFQEGLVSGVYFRFDPDGYARFSPSPRLDTDVFEVICRPRTYSCMGRKPGLSVLRTTRGEIQLQFDEVLEGDAFFVSEGISEIQLPNRILQPLSFQLETLLSSGGELVVRRGGNEISRVSLQGFTAVATYLRWVAAGQDYTVMPAGWPVPQQLETGAQAPVTRPTSWNSPMPQPPVADRSVGAAAEIAPVAEEVAQVRGELSVLRDLLLSRDATATAPQPSPSIASELEELQQLAAQLRNELDASSASPTAPMAVDPVMDMGMGMDMRAAEPVPNPMMATKTPVTNAAVPRMMEQDGAQQAAARLEYLMREIGLDLNTALAVLQMTPTGTDETTKPGMQPVHSAPTVFAQQEDDIVSQILLELEADLAEAEQAEPAAAPEPVLLPPDEFKLLSDYFQSVALPRALGAVSP